MTSIDSGYSVLRPIANVEPKSEEKIQANNTTQSAPSRTVHDQSPRLVSRNYLKGEQVNEQSFLGKLRQKLGQKTQVAVHRSKGSGELFATGVSNARLTKLQRPTSNESQANLKAAERILKAAKIDIPGMTADQKIRLAILTAREPQQAFEVVARAHGNTKDLDLILGTAEIEGLDTRSMDELVQSKRAQLTKPTSAGGLGIDPKNLVLKKDLGHGNFGAVMLYEDPQTGRQFAAKIITKQEIGGRTLEDEEQMLARLPDNENLVKSFGIHKVGKDEKEVLLQEFVCGGNLKSVVKKLDWKNLSADDQQKVFKHAATQIFRGLAELQKLGIAHEDVRAENLLFDPKTLSIKLGDFGLATERGESVGEHRPWKWSPPEILSAVNSNENPRASITEDTFSAGRVLVGELVPHTNLFNKAVSDESISNVPLELLSVNLSGLLPDRLHPTTRGELNKVDKTEKMADFFEAISHPDPSQRLRAHEALKHEFLATPVPREDLNRIFKPVTDQFKDDAPNVVPSNPSNLPTDAPNNLESPYRHSSL